MTPTPEEVSKIIAYLPLLHQVQVLQNTVYKILPNVMTQKELAESPIVHRFCESVNAISDMAGLLIAQTK